MERTIKKTHGSLISIQRSIKKTLSSLTKTQRSIKKSGARPKNIHARPENIRWSHRGTPPVSPPRPDSACKPGPVHPKRTASGSKRGASGAEGWNEREKVNRGTGKAASGSLQAATLRLRPRSRLTPRLPREERSEQREGQQRTRSGKKRTPAGNQRTAAKKKPGARGKNPHRPQAPDTRALFRSDRQYAAVTAMPSNTASEPPMTATSFGAAIQNPA